MFRNVARHVFVTKRVGEMGVVDTPVPFPGPNDAIVRSTAGLSCISDRHTVRGATGDRTKTSVLVPRSRRRGSAGLRGPPSEGAHAAFGGQQPTLVARASVADVGSKRSEPRVRTPQCAKPLDPYLSPVPGSTDIERGRTVVLRGGGRASGYGLDLRAVGLPRPPLTDRLVVEQGLPVLSGLCLDEPERALGVHLPPVSRAHPIDDGHDEEPVVVGEVAANALSNDRGAPLES